MNAEHGKDEKMVRNAKLEKSAGFEKNTGMEERTGKGDRLLCMTFLFLLAAGFLLCLFLPKAGYSDSERRKLTPAPAPFLIFRHHAHRADELMYLERHGHTNDIIAETFI